MGEGELTAVGAFLIARASVGEGRDDEDEDEEEGGGVGSGPKLGNC